MTETYAAGHHSVKTIRGNASSVGWSLRHDALLRGASRRYAERLGATRQRSGMCFEFATIGAEIARELRLDAAPCVGTWRSPTGPVAHAWLSVGDFVLHSPLPGEVEVLPRSAHFVAHRA